MLAPTVTPDLAERCLIGAALHALAARATASPTSRNAKDLDFARRVPAAEEIAASTTAYALTLVWWAREDVTSRRELLNAATDRMMHDVADCAADRLYAGGYRIYAERLTALALAPHVHAIELDLSEVVSGVREIDLMTARFADAAVRSVLRSDRRAFGDPRESAELMRDEMIQLAYWPQAA